MSTQRKWRKYIMNLKIKGREVDYPIIQGAMGVGVSLGGLSGAVAREGAIGTISMVGIGYREEDYYKDSMGANKRAFKKEMKKARDISGGKGLIGANIMAVLNGYEKLVKMAVEEKVDFIISGAGLPLNLPGLVEDGDILLAPIVSSARALKLINRMWKKKYNRLPDFVVLEGSSAGGHLGFKKEEIEEGKSLEELTVELADYLQELKEDTGEDIPFFVAGSTYDGYDLKKYKGLGASGIQIGTRFIGTDECDADKRYKDFIVQAEEEDLAIINSPVGILGRAVDNNFLEEVEEERKPSKKCINCLEPCDPGTTRYCISDALVNAVKGNVQEGLVFAGSNVGRVERIEPVKDIINQIVKEYREV